MVHYALFLGKVFVKIEYSYCSTIQHDNITKYYRYMWIIAKTKWTYGTSAT